MAHPVDSTHRLSVFRPHRESTRRPVTADRAGRYCLLHAYPDPGDGYPMKAFLAVSLAPGAGEPAGLSRAAGRVSAARPHRTDDGWVAFGEPEQDDRTDDPEIGRASCRE